MTKIIDLIRRAAPRGTDYSNVQPDWKKCPVWPPDVFALCALIVECNGTYTKRDVVSGRIFDSKYHKEVDTEGERWREKLAPASLTKRLWRDLIKSSNEILGEFPSSIVQDWEIAALKLLAISDNASLGLGFPLDYFSGLDKKWSTPSDKLGFWWVLTRAMMQCERLIAQYKSIHKAPFKKRHSQYSELSAFPALPESICHIVSPLVACVLPKTNTPRVGCTLRSLSHNLALLPSRGIVAAEWRNHAQAGMNISANGHALASSGRMERESEKNLGKPVNLLLIPYPYSISGRSFSPSTITRTRKQGTFKVEPIWLLDKGTKRRLSLTKAINWMCQLIDTARKEIDEIHGIVLPEIALPHIYAKKLADGVALRNRDLEFFVSGVSSETPASENFAMMNIYNRGRLKALWSQKKHHKWKLSGDQVTRYNFGHMLDPTIDWWEDIDVSNRTCSFGTVRPRASLAVLVCEDLARFDPVMPVVNSIGPTLVIALLMDGAQLPARWTARSAGVLADDPGCSVLTLTSLGMVKRVPGADAGGGFPVALFRQPAGEALSLRLPAGHQALALSLTPRYNIQYTLDGRSDHGATPNLELGACRPIKMLRKGRGMGMPSQPSVVRQ